VNRKQVLRVMRERSLLVRARRLRARRKKESGRVESEPAERNLGNLLRDANVKAIEKRYTKPCCQDRRCPVA
jgi:hypothetical protein